MIKTLFTFLFGLSFFSLSAQEFQFVNVLSGSLDAQGYGMTTDNNNNSITVGFFTSNSNFNPGVGSAVAGNGDKDVFVQKADAQGTILWTKAFGGSGNDRAYNTATDNSGNVYITGRFENSIDLDPGTGSQLINSGGNADAFLLKLDATGNFVWAKRIGDSADDHGTGLAINAEGNVIWACNVIKTGNEFDVDPDPTGEEWVTMDGDENTLLLKLDPDGNKLWHGLIISIDQVWANDVATDSKNNIVVTGKFNDNVDFDPSNNVHELTTGSAGDHFDLFVAQFDTNGALNWAHGFGSFGDDRGQSITVDGEDNVITGGYFENSFNIAPGGGFGLSVNNYRDGFIQKLTSEGEFIWAKQLSGDGLEWIHVIDADNHGNVYATGWFDGDIDVDPSASEQKINSAGESDIFVVKLTADGDLNWAQTFGDQWGDQGQGLAVDQNGTVLMTGFYDGDFDADPGFGVTQLPNTAVNNALVWSYRPEIDASQMTDDCAMAPSIKPTVIFNGTEMEGAVINVHQKIDEGWWPTSMTMTGSDLMAMPDTGRFVISATLDKGAYPTALTTYYGGSSFWNEAQVMEIGCGTGHSMTIVINEKLPMSGAGRIFGTVSYKNGINKVSGDPIPGLDVVLEKTPPGQIVSQTTTDEIGAYDFINLDTGIFVVRVNAPGLEQLVSVDIQLDEGEEVGTETSFLADTTAGTVELDGAVGIKTTGAFENFQMYPNPANSRLFLNLKQAGKLVIMDMTGQVVLTRNVGQPSLINLDLTVISGGVYFVQFSGESNNLTKRLVIER